MENLFKVNWCNSVMKAIILSAGEGTRIRKINHEVPKVLIPIIHKPMILWNIELLKEYGIIDIAINTHYMATQIKEYLDNGKRYGVNILYSYEKELLGTAGALKNFKDFFNDTFVVLYGDVISKINLKELIKFHKKNNAIGTLVVHKTDHPEDSDIVCVDKNNKIINTFHKSGKGGFGTLGNAAMYILEPEVLNYIDSTPCDFFKDIFPQILKDGKKLMAYDTKEFIKDAGTPNRIIEVEEKLKKIITGEKLRESQNLIDDE